MILIHPDTASCVHLPVGMIRVPVARLLRGMTPSSFLYRTEQKATIETVPDEDIHPGYSTFEVEIGLFP